jgi:hypothetical protein
VNRTKGSRVVPTWQEHDKLLEQIDARVGSLAGCALALDPYTLLLMFHAETEDDGKLAYMPRGFPTRALRY